MEDVKLEMEARRMEAISGRLVTVLDPSGAAAEAYRTLRTNLFYSLVDDPPRAIAITSPGPGEGKSTTAANLAVALAQASRRTLLLDCDLRKPAQHTMFGLRNLHGLADVISGAREPQRCWYEALESLAVLTAGPIPPNPAELLSSRRFAAFLSRVREEFDYVILDAPPVEAVSDPLILATHADGVLLVVDARHTRKAAVRRSMKALESVEAAVLGAVMNNVDASRGGYKGYGAYTYR